jgi:hypothetical protein
VFVPYEYAWSFVKYTFHTYSMLLKMSSFCTTHKSSVSTGFTEQIMPILRIVCYNGSLVTWNSDLILFCTTYIASWRTYRKHIDFLAVDVYRCPEFASTAPLPSNGYSIVERLCHGNVFADTFPASGSTYHSTIRIINQPLAKALKDTHAGIFSDSGMITACFSGLCCTYSAA